MRSGSSYRIWPLDHLVYFGTSYVEVAKARRQGEGMNVPVGVSFIIPFTSMDIQSSLL